MSRPSSSRIFAVALLSLVLGTTGCGSGGAEDVPGGRPIIVVSVDTLRSDRLPAYGYDGVETPAIDALREDAVLFERAYSPVPLTLPAHASLLTGLLPPDHGVRDNLGYRLEESVGTTVADRLRTADYATGAAVSAFVMRAETGLARGFDLYDDRLEETPRATTAEIQRSGGDTLATALDWLDTVADRPFFLFLHIYEPHTPWEPPPEIAARYGATYDGEVVAADAVVGALLDGLRERDLYDGSTVLFLSDHGEGLGDHGEQEHGVLLYRESLQVPLLLKLPGNRLAGAAVKDPVQLIDVPPTLLELAGVVLPEGLSGASLLSFALPKRETQPAGRPLYAETFHPQLRFGWSGLTSVIAGRHHYIEGTGRELFDVVADPAERKNLLRGERRIYARLRDALHRFDARLAPPFEEESEAREALASLGYLGGVTTIPAGELPDPRDQIAGIEPLQRGISRLREGRDADAIALLRKATEAIPRSVDAWQFLALALQRTGSAEEAYTAYEHAFELSNGSPLLTGPMGQAALEAGRYDEAAALLAVAVEDRPDALPPRLNQTLALRLGGRLDEALSAARAATQLAPGNPDARHQLGAVHMERRELDRAETELRRALEASPNHPAALEDLAVLLAHQGRVKEASTLLEQLVEVQPENQAAREMLTRLGS